MEQLFVSPLIKSCTLAPEMKQEALDICCGAVEKNPADAERCSQARSAPAGCKTWMHLPHHRYLQPQAIKESMDRKFGGPWQVVTGKAFSYDVSAAASNMLFVYLGTAGVGVLLWRR